MDVYEGVSDDHAWDRRGHYRLYSSASGTSTFNSFFCYSNANNSYCHHYIGSEGSKSVAVVAQVDDEDEERFFSCL